jgi:hypothetical protein
LLRIYSRRSGAACVSDVVGVSVLRARTRVAPARIRNCTVFADVVLDPVDGPFSVFAWVKGGAAGRMILSQDGGVGGDNWLGVNAARRLMTALGGQVLTASQVIADNQWHEVGLRWDGRSRTFSVDGVDVATNKPAGCGNLRGVDFASRIYKLDLGTGAVSMLASGLNYPRDIECVKPTGGDTVACCGRKAGDRVILLTNTPRDSVGSPAVGAARAMRTSASASR